MTRTVLQLRVALTTSDYDRLLKFYCDGLGLEPAAVWDNEQGQATMLEMGQATLEIFDEEQADTVDRLVAHGAELVHPPVVTPWGDRNARVQDPDGMQITLFQTSENPA